jgi:hypothetical protein
MARRKTKLKAVEGFVSTPATVRADIARTDAFIHSLTDEILAAYKAEPLPVSADKSAFFTQYRDWHKGWAQFVGQNGGDTWWPDQYLAYLTIEDQNTQYDKEARDHQAHFRSLGFTSTTIEPAKEKGPGGFLAGLGSGGVIALLAFLYFSQKKSR